MIMVLKKGAMVNRRLWTEKRRIFITVDLFLWDE